MKNIESYFRSFLLPVLGLGLFVPATGLAFTSTDTGAYSAAPAAQQFEHNEIASMKAGIEKSILHRSTPIEIVVPRVIYSEVDLHDIEGMKLKSENTSSPNRANHYC